jgi:hypothetical protein
MRDDLASINLGQAGLKYDNQFFYRSYRDMEMFMTRLLSKGPVEVSSLIADTATIGALTATSATGINGKLTVNADANYGIETQSTQPTGGGLIAYSADYSSYAILGWGNAYSFIGKGLFENDGDALFKDNVQVTGNLTATGNVIAKNVVGGIKVTVFTVDGTFTPDAKMIFCEVTAWGGGGAGGGAPATAAAQVSAGTGGNGGAKSYGSFNAAAIGASKAVDIGAGGTGVSGANGNPGAVTTLGGTLLSAKGGEGGVIAAVAAAVGPLSATATQSAIGDIRGWTYPAAIFAYGTTSQFAIYGLSGAGELGGAINGALNANGTAANANTGAGGGGTLNTASQVVRTGGTGGSGFMIIREYLSS